MARPRIKFRSLRVTAAFRDFVLDQLSRLPQLRSKKMFGGVGLYSGDCFFGIVAADELFFKVDDSNRDDYVRHGSRPFQPFKDDPTYSMNYFSVPEDVLEDPDELQRWTRRALAVAASASAAKEQRSRAAKKRQRSISPSKTTRRKR